MILRINDPVTQVSKDCMRYEIWVGDKTSTLKAMETPVIPRPDETQVYVFDASTYEEAFDEYNAVRDIYGLSPEPYK